MADHKAPDDIFKVSSPVQNAKARIVMLTADGTEDQEFFYPYYRFSEAGYQVDVITPDGKGFKGKNGAGLSDTMIIPDANPNNYELLYIPGDKAPEKLKSHEPAVEFVQDFVMTGKPVAAICHGPQLLAKAGVIEGKRIAAWPECEDEVEDAGASYVFEECVRDGQFITARWPGDLPAHLSKIFQVLQSAKDTHKKAA